MTLELVVGGGLLALVAIGAITVVGVWRGRVAQRGARESWERTVATGALPPSLHPRVDLERCIGSGTCVEVCPELDVLAVVDGKARIVNPTACIGHGECLRACPVDAIQLVIGHEKRGVDIPLVSRDFETSTPGLYVVGELGGMGLVYNAMTQALQCVAAIRKQKLPKIEGVHQIAIVGAGPAGLAASVAALDAGLDAVTLEQESIGGTVLHYPRHKIVMTKPVTLPRYGRIKVSEVQKEALLATWEDIVAKTGVQIRTHTKVEGVTRGEDGVFTLQTSGGPVRAQRVVLALGRRGSPRKIGVPGEEQAKVTYRLLDAEQYAGRHVLVVGGGDAAVECAIGVGDAGGTVHLAHRGKVFDRIKPKNQEKLDAAVAAGRVTLLMEAATKEIAADKVTIEAGGARKELPNDYVIVQIGGVLPTKFLQDAGVTVQTYKGEAFAPANR